MLTRLTPVATLLSFINLSQWDGNPVFTGHAVCYCACFRSDEMHTVCCYYWSDVWERIL